MQIVKKYFKIFLELVLLAGFLAVLLDIFSASSGKGGFFTVSRGDNILQISGKLHSQGYIGSRIIFIYDVLKSGEAKKIKSGRYEIKKDSTNEEILKDLTTMKSLPLNILIAPGKNVDDISRILSGARLVNRKEFLDEVLNKSGSYKYSFLADKPEKASLEGYLYPDNYLIDPEASNADIIKQFLDNFDKKFTVEERKEIISEGRKVFDVITLASILEKEVKTYKDKQIVAGILLKRIKNYQPLEVDSTLLYFLVSDHPSVLDRDVNSPYNTYRRMGLPAGPICNPGKESILAAINPIDSDYWFYLSAADGETIYSKNLGEHLINKAKYLK